jgi:acyl-CoA thioesterase-2
MTTQTNDLLSLLNIERLEVDLFRGRGDGGETVKRIYGGQVIAQALVAAYRTVEDRLCHSLHAYFIRPGDPSIPVIYEVDRARDGRSFTTRRVIAIQKGKQIFNLAASFHKQEDGWAHQHDMPAADGPEGLAPFEDRRAEVIDRIPEALRPQFNRNRPIDMREVGPLDLFQPQPTSDANQMWFRVKEKIDQPPWVHHCLLAYASDMALLGSANRPHGIAWLGGKAMWASLDHAMWFHAPIRFDDWHLYDMDSPFAGGARSFNRGRVFSKDGRLVASVAQEGLRRPVKPQ